MYNTINVNYCYFETIVIGKSNKGKYKYRNIKKIMIKAGCTCSIYVLFFYYILECYNCYQCRKYCIIKMICISYRRKIKIKFKNQGFLKCL